MSAFTRALDFTLAWEGGYVNHPDDPGGETNHGISKRAYPHLDIRNLTREQAAEIYRTDYWQRARCPELPEAVAVAHFDAAVNCGPIAAARFLQRAAGVVADGVIGPVTLGSVRAANPAELVAWMLFERAMHHLRITGDNRSLASFARGWSRRIEALAAAVR